MAFKFRLEKVLQHRKSLEDIAKKNLLVAQNALREAEDLLTHYNRQIEVAQRERHALVVSGGSQGERLSQIYEYIKGTEIKIERQKIEVQKNLSIVENMKLALQHAAIEYKMIEKLKDRQRHDYRQYEKKLEEKEQTEISNASFDMRRRNG